MPEKNLKVSNELHKKLRDYCQKHGLILYRLTETILLEYLEKKTKENKNGSI